MCEVEEAPALPRRRKLAESIIPAYRQHIIRRVDLEHQFPESPEHHRAVVLPFELTRCVRRCIFRSFCWELCPHLFFWVENRRLQIQRLQLRCRPSDRMSESKYI